MPVPSSSASRRPIYATRARTDIGRLRTSRRCTRRGPRPQQWWYGNQGGHYAGGKGISHKGGTYKNARINDHYTKHC